MRLVVDATAASYGGIATYAENLLAGWARRFPDDELHVVLPAGADWWPLPDDAIRHDVRLIRPATLARPVAITAELPRLVRSVNADAVLATNPATTLLRAPAALGVVVHDMRHELRPEQFPVARRVIRRTSYRWGFARADVVIAVSQRTLDDVRQRCPRLPAQRCVVVHEGGDHVDRWRRGEPNGTAVASCHHSNKDTDLLIDAWAELGAAAPPLAMLGISGPRADITRARIAAAGLADRITVQPFLPTPDYERLVTGARMVVFVSDFEGFGLPVVESMRLGKPIVIAPEPACLEVAGGHAVVITDWTAPALAQAVRDALAASPAELDAARRYVEDFTWAATATGVREALLRARR